MRIKLFEAFSESFPSETLSFFEAENELKGKDGISIGNIKGDINFVEKAVDSIAQHLELPGGPSDAFSKAYIVRTDERVHTSNADVFLVFKSEKDGGPTEEFKNKIKDWAKKHGGSSIEKYFEGKNEGQFEDRDESELFEMTDVMYDTLMGNKNHIQFDTKLVDDGSPEKMGNKFSFIYEGIKYEVTVERA